MTAGMGAEVGVVAEPAAAASTTGASSILAFLA